MENLKSDFAGLIENTHDLAQKQTQIVRLEIYERLTNIISKGIINIFLIIICCFILSLINFGVAYFLGEYFKSIPLGFIALGGFYLVVLIVFLILRKRVAKNSLKNAILRGFTHEIKDYDELLKNQNDLSQELEISKSKLQQNIHSLKTRFGLEKEDEVESDLSSASSIEELADSIYKKIFKKQPGPLTKILVPIAINSILKSLSKKENEKGPSLFEQAKIKLTSFIDGIL